MLEQTLSELSTQIPGATAIFNQHKLKFCCGETLCLKDALSQNNIDPKPVLSALETLKNQHGSGDSKEVLQDLSNQDLIQHLLQRYHEVHRKQLSELVRLSSRVESVHGDRSACPKGLADHLSTMHQELEQHMRKEEQILFPMLQQGMNTMAQGPINVMRHEHDEHASSIEKIIELTDNLALPSDACNTWRALYILLDEFMQDLQRHISIENDILFSRT